MGSGGAVATPAGRGRRRGGDGAGVVVGGGRWVEDALERSRRQVKEVERSFGEGGGDVQLPTSADGPPNEPATCSGSGAARRLGALEGSGGGAEQHVVEQVGARGERRDQPELEVDRLRRDEAAEGAVVERGHHRLLTLVQEGGRSPAGPFGSRRPPARPPMPRPSAGSAYIDASASSPATPAMRTPLARRMRSASVHPSDAPAAAAAAARRRRRRWRRWRRRAAATTGGKPPPARPRRRG